MDLKYVSSVSFSAVRASLRYFKMFTKKFNIQHGSMVVQADESTKMVFAFNDSEELIVNVDSDIDRSGAIKENLSSQFEKDGRRQNRLRQRYFSFLFYHGCY